MILAELTPGAAARPGVVYLVGAGPGDPGLVTIRALELLATADVVLHDELAPRGLLARASPTAEVRWVGKRGHSPDDKQKKQHEIDAELVALAQAGRSVVRLKGGDPFLFGRGSEEAESLARAGVPFEVVPGVTSPLAVAAYAGISLTHRDLASSVTFISAVTRTGERFDAARLRGLGGTLCVLMGLHGLRQLAADLIELAAWPASTRVAIISAGTRPDQRVVEGDLTDIADRVDQARLPTPALAVIGAVAELRDRLRWFDRMPLFGRRVLLARGADQATSTAALLTRRGAAVIDVPLIRFEAPDDPAPLQRAAAELGDYQVVALTSRNGVARLMEAIAATGRDARAFGSARIAAVGDGTAAELARHGLRADVTPERFVGAALADAILADLASRPGTADGGGPRGKRILLARAQVAGAELPDRLRAAGATVEDVAAYRTAPTGDEHGDHLRSLLVERGLDVVLLTSASTVDRLCDVIGEGAAEALSSTLVASIGPVTTAAATRRGVQVDLTARVSTVPALVESIEAHLEGVQVSTPDLGGESLALGGRLPKGRSGSH